MNKILKYFIFIITIFFTSCSPNNENEKIKLEIMLPSGDYQEVFKEEVIPRFTKENPQIDILLSDDRNLETRIAAGDSPNLYAGTFGYIPAKYAKLDLILPLDEFEDFEDLKSKINDKFMYKNFGQYYYIPWNATTTIMIYNKELFKEAGLDPEKPPKTWKEYLEYAEKISKLPNREDGTKVYGNVFWNEMLNQGGWYWSMLAPIYYSGNNGKYQLLNKFGTNVIFNEKEAYFKEFLSFMKEAQKYAPKTMEQNFFSRNIGMWLQFGYGWKGNLKNAKGSPMIIGKDVGIAVIPVREERMTSYSTLDGRALMIFRNKNEKKEKAAWEMIKFLMREDINQITNEKLAQLPVLKSLKNNEYYKTNEIKIFMEQLENTIINEPFAYSDYIQTTVLQEYTETVVLNRKSIEKGLKAAIEKSKKYIISQQN